MFIKVDGDNKVIGYASLGGIEGGIEYEGTVPENFNAETCKFFKLENEELIYIPELESTYENLKTLNLELAELLGWFSWYDNQIIKILNYERRGQTYHISLEELDIQAETNRQRINEIRNLLNEV